VGIIPKIICEQYIETDDGLPPKDYKIFCSYGKPKFLYIASKRNGMNTKFDYFDLNWNWIAVKNGHENAEAIFTRPPNFDEMLSLASKLSKPFPLVRVHLYNENGEIIFGELTFCHYSGVAAFEPDNYDTKFGSEFPDVRGCGIRDIEVDIH